MAHKHFNAARLHALASSVSRISASVADHTKLSPTVAKVIVSLSSDKFSNQEAAAAITASLGGAATPVLGSFRAIPGANCVALAGFVRLSQEVMHEDDPRYATMRPVTANIMLDPQDSKMWDVRSGAAGSFLVRAGEEDLSSLLVTATMREVGAPRMAALASCSASGEFVKFVDATSGELRSGFVLASDGEQVEVVTEEDENPVVTGEDSIVEAAMLHGGDVVVAESVGIDAKDFNSTSKSAMTEYYKRLYSYAPGYVADIQKQIDSHASV